MYGKIFDLIYDGTLYGHWEAIVTMQQMIVLSTPDGVVDMTPQALAARTSIPLDIITKGLQVLSEPDPYTRTPGEEGRRIVLMDDHRPWGWRLVNHGKYMRLRDMKQKRASDRERIEEKRKKNKHVAIASQSVANVAHSDSDSDSDLKSRSVRSRGSRLPPDWKLTEPLKAWCLAKRPDLDLEVTAERFKDFWISKAGKDGVKLDWDATWRNWCRNENGRINIKASQAWWMSDATIIAEGRKFGLEAKPGESMANFKGRVQNAIRET